MQVNQEQFRIWHDQYRPRLLNSMTAFTGNRDAAEDVTAAAFSTAFQHLDTFRGRSSFYTWLHAIALNEVRSKWRNGTMVLESIDRSSAKELMEPDVLPQMLERSECCERIRVALRRVPAAYRKVLVDHFIRGDSVKQIAKRNRIPVGTVLSRIFTAKRLLRAAWAAAT